MAEHIQQDFPVKCLGRDHTRKPVLEEAVHVQVNIHQNPDSDTISSSVNCIHIHGSHSQYCNASGEGNTAKIVCPYSFDLPNALDK